MDTCKWRKVQELGLATLYKELKDIQHFCGMLDGLAFLPVDDVQAGMNFLRNNLPELDNDNQKLADLVQYFDATYVSARIALTHQSSWRW